MIATSAVGGEIRNGRHYLAVRVYYEDTDFSGAVYHASYLRFLERGRTEYLRALGIEQGSLERSGTPALGFVVRHMSIDFLKPARMDDLVMIQTAQCRLGGASLTLSQRVWRGSEALVSAVVRIAVVAQGRPVRIPTELRRTLAALNPQEEEPALLSDKLRP